MDSDDDEFQGRKAKHAAAFAKHLRMLLERAQLFLGPRRGDAQDFVHDAWVSLLDSFPADPPQDPHCGRFLMRTLVNRLISDWRKLVVREQALLGPWPPSGSQVLPFDLFAKPSMAELVEERLTPEDFAMAVGSLPPKLREPYLLLMDHLSYREIAKRLGISEVNARQRICKARKRLAIALRLRLGEDSE